ncbi:DUF4252 domain-containing protein [Ascidiimonas aurantiaca]|uniref:DUF4252 domain-containing protein n=1 Tax=Ascidiimonas aurantiaca TaxID=1685432 RepID=UPI0030EE6AA8
MRTVRTFFLLLIAGMLFQSCNNSQSLQQYYVDNQANSDFMAIDFHTSMLNIEEADLDEAQKEAYQSIRKLNVLAFKLTEENKQTFEEERIKVREILKNPRYKDLVKLNSGGIKATVKYLGEEDAIDEVIIFGINEEMGFAVVRVLGEDMRPENVMKLMSVVEQSGAGENSLEALKGFLGQ